MTQKKICRTEDIPSNGLKECQSDDGTAVLVINSGDEFYACNAICPHQEVPLCEGMFDGKVLTCHMHLWQWDITTGAPIGLAEAPLEMFDVSVEEGWVCIGASSALRVASLFEGIAQETLEKIDAIAEERTCAEGEVLYTVGDSADDLYILESGRVEFLVGRDGKVTSGGFMVRKGEVFGWAPLMENQKQRIAQATCKETVTLLALNGAKVRGFLEEDPRSGMKVMMRLSSLLTRYMIAAGTS
ncbi:MAG: cyclic nucleotide-binding domain-containing protein [Pirellulaceae bacterium]